MDCDSDSSLSEPPDSDEESDADSSCTSLPAVFYNCDFMGSSQALTNLNEDTSPTVPTYTFISICENIRHYLNNAPATTPGGQTVTSGTNWMQLTYFRDPTNANRAAACGKGNKGDKQSACASTKSAMWPTAVYNAAQVKGSNYAYKQLAGHSDSISCDEFPFNGRVLPTPPDAFSPFSF